MALGTPKRNQDISEDKWKQLLEFVTEFRVPLWYHCGIASILPYFWGEQNFISFTCDVIFAPAFLKLSICPSLCSAETGGSGRTYCMHLNIVQCAGYTEQQCCLNKLHLQAYRWMNKFPQGFLEATFVYFAISSLQWYHFWDKNIDSWRTCIAAKRKKMYWLLLGLVSQDCSTFRLY